MRVIRSQVIVLISSSQNELQHPEWMQELQELGNSKEAPGAGGKVWLEWGSATCEERVGSCSTPWQPGCHWDYWGSRGFGAFKDQ